MSKVISTLLLLILNLPILVVTSTIIFHRDALRWFMRLIESVTLPLTTWLNPQSQLILILLIAVIWTTAAVAVDLRRLYILTT